MRRPDGEFFEKRVNVRLVHYVIMSLEYKIPEMCANATTTKFSFEVPILHHNIIILYH